MQRDYEILPDYTRFSEPLHKTPEEESAFRKSWYSILPSLQEDGERRMQSEEDARHHLLD